MTNEINKEKLEKLVVGNPDEQLKYGKDKNLGAAYFMLKNYLETQTVFDAKGWFDCFWGRIAEIVSNRKLDNGTSNWISIDDRLPDSSGRYLVTKDIIGKNEYDIASFYAEKQYFFTPGIVTHWMPLPPLPSEIV